MIRVRTADHYNKYLLTVKLTEIPQLLLSELRDREQMRMPTLTGARGIYCRII